MMSEVVSIALAQKKVMSGDLPQVLHCMLSHLPVADVCRLSTVCRAWNELANKNQLWRALCHRDKVSVPQELQVHQGQWCYYKSVYQKYRETRRKWLTGEESSTFSSTLVRTNGMDKMRCLAICSRYILTGGMIFYNNYNISVYYAVTGWYSHQLSGLASVPRDVRVSNDETIVVANSLGGDVVCVWNLENGELLRSLDHPGGVVKIDLHGSMLAVGMCGASPPAVFVWNIESGRLVHQLYCVRQELMVMDGQHIALYDELASVVQLWDVISGTHCFTWNQVGYCKLLLDSATKSLVGILPNEVCIWDTETGACRGTVTAGAGYHYEDMLVHNGTLVIAVRAGSSGQGTLSVVDLRAAQMEQSLMQLADVGHGIGKFVVQAVCGGLIIMAGPLRAGACITLWDMEQRRCVRSVHGPEDRWIRAVRVSFNRLQLAIQDSPLHGTPLVAKVYDFSA